MNNEFKVSDKKLIIVVISVLVGVLLLLKTINFFVTFKERQQERIYLTNYNNTDYGDYDGLKTETEKMLEKYPNNVEALIRKGYLEIRFGSEEKGILINEEVLELNPQYERTSNDLSIVYNNLSWAYNRKGLYQLALFYGEKAIRYNTDGDLLHDYGNTGNAYQGLQEYEKAIDYYKKAIDYYKKEIFSYNVDHQPSTNSQEADSIAYIWQGQGECYLMLDKKGAAFASFMECFELFPGNYSAFNSLFNCYAEKNDISSLDGIVYTYVRNCGVREKSYAYNRLAYAYSEDNKHSVAAKCYLLAAKYAEYKGHYYYQAALSYAQYCNNEFARKYLSKAIEADEYYKDIAEKEPLLEGLYE